MASAEVRNNVAARNSGRNAGQRLLLAIAEG
jgi:hypothetical protein